MVNDMRKIVISEKDLGDNVKWKYRNRGANPKQLTPITVREGEIEEDLDQCSIENIFDYIMKIDYSFFYLGGHDFIGIIAVNSIININNQ